MWLMSYYRSSLLLCIAVALTLSSCMGRHDRYAQMLEEAEWMNRNDSLFTSDSIGLALVQHYDHWWHSSNHRMRAYYMLGCAYRDMGEAPAAIHYYTIATEQVEQQRPSELVQRWLSCDDQRKSHRVDTFHTDSATYATLFRIYGQMAMVYEQQNMPSEKLKALDSYCHYALLAKDTLSYVMGEERKILAYYSLDDTIKIFSQTEKVRQKYIRLGQRELAARTFPTAIYVHLLNENYAEAWKLMNIFEQESGRFDEKGNIEEGHEQYYYSKGLYFLGIGQSEQAEHYFRKLVSYGYLYEAYKGLLSIYREKQNIDSIVKYAALSEDALGRWLGKQQANTIIQSSAMYNYERNRNKAEKEANKAKALYHILALILLFVIIAAMLIYIRLNRIKQIRLEQELEYRKLVEEHMEMQATYQQLCKKLHKLEEDNNKLQQKEDINREIQLLKNQIGQYNYDIQQKESQLRKEDIVSLFREMSVGGYNGKRPTKKEWQKLSSTYKKYLPHIFARMQVAKLSKQELFVAILSHLDFSTNSVANLYEATNSAISKAKSKANKKLFGEESAFYLVKNLKKCAYLKLDVN